MEGSFYVKGDSLFFRAGSGSLEFIVASEDLKNSLLSPEVLEALAKTLNASPMLNMLGLKVYDFLGACRDDDNDPQLSLFD